MADGLVAGVVGALNEILSSLLIAFTKVLTTLDISGILKEPIRHLSGTMVTVGSALSLFGSLTRSDTNMSDSSTGNESVDFATYFSPKLQDVLETILKFESLARFDFRAVIEGLVYLENQYNVLCGEKIIGAGVEIYEMTQALIESLIKAVTAKNFQLIGNIGLRIIHVLIAGVDYFVSVAASILEGVKGATPAVADVFNGAIASDFGVVGVLFTAVQTVVVASQGTLYQLAQGAGDAIQAAIRPAQTVLADLIQLIQAVLQPVSGFIAKCTVFVNDRTSFGSDFVTAFNTEVRSFAFTFINTFLRIAAAFNYILGINVTSLGQLSRFLFGNLDIDAELTPKIKFVASSVHNGAGLLSSVKASGSIYQ